MADFIPPTLFSVLGDRQRKAKLLQSVRNIYPVVTPLDIERELKRRYFAKYTSQKNGLIYELDATQYQLIKNNPLYYKTSIDWIIRGKLEDTILTFADGTNMLVKGVISQNKTSVSIAESELPGITRHLTNYIELYSGE